MAGEKHGMIVTVSRSELLTGKLDRPMSKEDLDVFRSYLAGRVDCAEDETRARDAVLMWRGGRAMAEKRERMILDAILGE